MSFTRRKFLKSGAMTALAAGMVFNVGTLALGQKIKKSAPSTGSQIPYEATQSPTFFFTRDTFAPYVGGTFRARAGAHSINMTLTSVRDCTPGAKSKLLTKKLIQSDCFALVFSATGTLTDLTTIYDIEHAALGKFALFMTRRDGPLGTYFYEAVFNHTL